ncbi:hypothetical protein LOAG_01921 [Loa loa]|uniref:Uncharacterized protein n=1 Tax=Loa loa TaxID=7209 RepID=A0A1S0U8M0_LOALO|nr:hypothetical protein LOAG_01921 [Loa loa]EFO26562.1 hypothetical protein LOAG_01921 [Loa loa]
MNTDSNDAVTENCYGSSNYDNDGSKSNISSVGNHDDNIVNSCCLVSSPANNFPWNPICRNNHFYSKIVSVHVWFAIPILKADSFTSCKVIMDCCESSVIS